MKTDVRHCAAATMILGLAAFGARPAAAADWYVDGLNGSRTAAGGASTPFLYLWQGLRAAQPGDTIYVVPSQVYAQLGFTASGTAAAPITLAGSDPAKPTKVSGMGVNSGLWINGDNVVVRNFDVTAPGDYPGVSVAPHRNHVTIADNHVHDCGANGITAFSDDYLTISHNTVWGNARDTSNGFSGSGISVLGSVDIDTNRGNKILIDGNIVFANTNTPACATASCLASAHDTDGSGIILDDNQRQRFDQVAYQGGFLISNNVSYRNGGRGIHIFRSDNVTVTGNTAYYNNQDPYEASWHPGEIAAIQSGNVRVFDNLLYSDGRDSPIHTGTAPNTHVAVMFVGNADGVGPMVATGNLAYNPQKDPTLLYYGKNNANPVNVGANIFSGPKLESPEQDDFRPSPDSPALGAAEPSVSVALDILGTARMPHPSIGAYQAPGP